MDHVDQRHPITRQRVVLRPANSFQPHVRRGVDYLARGDGSHTLDLYYPGPDRAPAPAVIFVSGLADVGALAFLGCRINQMALVCDWATLVAESGLVAVTYTTSIDTIADTRAMLGHLRANGRRLGIDTGRLGLWSCSAHVPAALGLLMDEPAAFRCAAMLYGFTLDLDGSSGVADAARVWRFANPARQRAVSHLPETTALFVARAGHDANPHLNDALDRFVAHALRRNLPITLVNHATGPHAFDVDEDSDRSRDIVRQALAFLRTNLHPSGSEQRQPQQ